MVSLDMENAEEFVGKFISLKDGNIVDVDCMKIHLGSKRNLSDVLKRGQVTKDNQRILIDKLLIQNSGKIILEEGQNSWVKNGNTYSFTTKCVSPTRFKAKLSTTAPLKNTTIQYACEILLGNFDLDLSECPAQFLDDGSVLYKKIPMMLYPGTYSYKVIE